MGADERSAASERWKVVRRHNGKRWPMDRERGANQSPVTCRQSPVAEDEAQSEAESESDRRAERRKRGPEGTARECNAKRCDRAGRARNEAGNLRGSPSERDSAKRQARAGGKSRDAARSAGRATPSAQGGGETKGAPPSEVKKWRRRPDLNRGRRFSRPLPDLWPTAPHGRRCPKN